MNARRGTVLIAILVAAGAFVAAAVPRGIPPATPSTPSTPQAPRDSVPFVAPDGSRVVRLALMRIAGSAGAPALHVEYSMVLPPNEVTIRPFASPFAGRVDLRYRVVWDAGGSRFAVLANGSPGRAGGATAPRLSTGEFVVLAVERAHACELPLRDLPADPGIERWQGGAPATLPLREFDIGKPVTGENAGTTGVLVHRGRAARRRERVQNLTVHANTQNCVPGRLATTPTLHVLTRQRQPGGTLEARLVTHDTPMLLLCEGEAFPDQQWVVAHALPKERALMPDRAPPRLVWTTDGRHLLLVTAPAGAPGFATLPGSATGDEVYLLFDVQQWQGVVAPTAAELAVLQFAK